MIDRTLRQTSQCILIVIMSLSRCYLHSYEQTRQVCLILALSLPCPSPTPHLDCYYVSIKVLLTLI